MLNTKIEFLYRDESNYKNWNVCILKGELTSEQANTILDSLHMGDLFIPEQVGLPVERFGSTTEDDTCWCELNYDFWSYTTGKETVSITPEQLTANFAAAKDHWDEQMYSVFSNGLDRFTDDELINELLKRKVSVTNESVHKLLENSGYFAYKLWTEDDIRAKLTELGFSDSTDNVAEICNNADINALGDCTDDDWYIIDNVIHNCADRLEPILPARVVLENDVSEDDVADILSDRYGFCVKAFTLEHEDGHLVASDIDWDMTD